MRIFLDANILFSASNKNSALYDFHFELSTLAELVTSQYALQEARVNIENKRPAWRDDFGRIITKVKLVSGLAKLPDIALREKDQPILAAAIAADCDLLLTGDKRDFGALYGKKIGGVTIVNYRILMEEFLS